MPGTGAGSAGTCFSGGVGSGGTFNPLVNTTTFDGGIRGGAGSIGFTGTGGGSFPVPIPTGGYQLGGAGNLTGYTDLSGGIAPDFNQGTGGVLLLFVEGSIIESEGAPANQKYFVANGAPGMQATSNGRYPAVYPFGGGSGGGVVIVVNKNAVNLGTMVEAKGGVVEINGPEINYRSGGDGAAVCYTFEQI